jgi:L-rhamnose mutarotase
MQFNPKDLPQYLKDHEAVWPEMQEALVRCGWHNYSLFYRPDGFAVGYFETDSGLEEAAKKMESEEVNTRWQETMKKYTAEGVRPDEAFGPMEQYFYLGADTK